MTVYAWPSHFPVSRFEMRIKPNTRVFTSPYTGTTQVLDLLGERWIISLEMPAPSDTIFAARREAFFDRLKGPSNSIAMGHQKLKRPQGTIGGSVASSWKTASGAASTWRTSSGAASTWMAGSPVIAFDIAQLANTGVIRTLPGRTLLAGDLIGMGGQLVRNMYDTQADSSGNMPFEFQPRARNLIPNGSAVLYDAPTANFILKPGTDGVPTSWSPGEVAGASFDLIETY